MQNEKQGTLIVITGPMFSGKTSRLLELLEREALAGRKTVLFKPEVDTRAEGMVVTHKGIRLPAIALKPLSGDTERIRTESTGFDAIGLDEAQFWNDGKVLAETLDRIANEGKRVYVSLLNRNNLGEPFGSAPELLARADLIYSLTAVCMRCGGEATYTQRMQNGQPIQGDVIFVGGKEAYEPRCRKCFVGPEKK